MSSAAVATSATSTLEERVHALESEIKELRAQFKNWTSVIGHTFMESTAKLNSDLGGTPSTLETIVAQVKKDGKSKKDAKLPPKPKMPKFPDTLELHPGSSLTAWIHFSDINIQACRDEVKMERPDLAAQDKSAELNRVAREKLKAKWSELKKTNKPLADKIGEECAARVRENNAKITKYLDENWDTYSKTPEMVKFLEEKRAWEDQTGKKCKTEFDKYLNQVPASQVAAPAPADVAPASKFISTI